MKRPSTSTTAWLNSKLIRFFVLLIGISLILFSTAVLVIASLNLPYSWPGLLFAIVGFWGAIACIRYFRNQRLALLVPIVATLLLIAIFLGMVFILGHKFDETRWEGSTATDLPSNKPIGSD